MAPPDAGIVLEGVRKEFPGGVVAVDDVSLAVEPGEFVVLVGPSGCGKSTTLRMVAGLEPLTAGTVRIGGRDVTKLAPRHRDVAMVFQNYALYAHMTVAANIGFGLKMNDMPKGEIAPRVERAAEILGITDLLKRKPRQLSGGQRQRVAMGRAIVREPAAFLMDEPLSNLDAKLRVEMRAEITTVQRRIGAPTLYVTHDQTEAMTMGDRVAILRDGVLEQLGTPLELYDAPVNTFVAGFIGSPAMNLVDATIEEDGGARFASFAGGRLPIARERRVSAGPVWLGLRPEDLGRDGEGVIALPVRRTESLGSETIAYLESGGERPLIARFDRRADLREGEPARIPVDLDRLYFFDRETGAAL